MRSILFSGTSTCTPLRHQPLFPAHAAHQNSPLPPLMVSPLLQILTNVTDSRYLSEIGVNNKANKNPYQYGNNYLPHYNIRYHQGDSDISKR